MEGAALLFRHPLEPGRPGDRRAALLRPHPAAVGRLGVEVVAVPLESDGVDVEALERALAAAPVKLAHVIPNFHNPAGCTLSEAKRRRLVELAGRARLLALRGRPLSR